MSEEEIRLPQAVESSPKIYALQIEEWRLALLPEWKIEICRSEIWFEPSTVASVVLFIGERIRSGSEAGQHFLAGAAVHGYLREEP